MPRYPNAIWRGSNKHGYPGNDTHLHQGLVIHSAEGSLAGLFSVLNGPRQASWHFSMTKDGCVYQHVDTSNIAWTNGSPEANTRFWGIECEGGGPGNRGEPLTEPQYQALVGVVRWLWETHGLTRYERQQTLWEHNEMTRFGSASTSCPSGRIPWDRLMMESHDVEEDDLMGKHISSPSHTGMEIGGCKLECVSPEQHEAIHAMGYTDTPITDAQWDALPNFGQGGGAECRFPGLPLTIS